MNQLTRAKRAEILGMMVVGVSLRAISRLTGASKNTVVNLLEDAGEAFSDYQDRTLRNLTCKRLQVDEVATFCGFYHLGRFSTLFRSRHDEPPSLILRRRSEASGG